MALFELPGSVGLLPETPQGFLLWIRVVAGMGLRAMIQQESGRSGRECPDSPQTWVPYSQPVLFYTLQPEAEQADP